MGPPRQARRGGIKRAGACSGKTSGRRDKLGGEASSARALVAERHESNETSTVAGAHRRTELALVRTCLTATSEPTPTTPRTELASVRTCLSATKGYRLSRWRLQDFLRRVQNVVRIRTGADVLGRA